MRKREEKDMEITKKRIFVILYSLLILIFTSCDKIKNFKSNDGVEKNSFISVNGYHLYKDEIDRLLPKGVSSEDSITIVNKFIDDWILDKLLYEQARKNLGDDKEIDKLVNDFRKTLVLNKYKTMLVDEKLSNNPDETEVLAFYENNPDMFQLNDEIIKGLFIKMPNNSTELNTFQKLYRDTTNEAIFKMEQKKLQNTVAFENFYDKWIDLNDVLDNIPLNIENHKEFLKSNSHLEFADSTFVYLLNIADYQLNGTAPFAYVKNNVERAYKNFLKDKFLEDLNNKLLENAKENNEIRYRKD